jgi:hypothetical protein
MVLLGGRGIQAKSHLGSEEVNAAQVAVFAAQVKREYGVLLPLIIFKNECELISVGLLPGQ